jgi:hypothetical protein
MRAMNGLKFWLHGINFVLRTYGKKISGVSHRLGSSGVSATKGNSHLDAIAINYLTLLHKLLLVK